MQMAIREHLFTTIQNIYKRHGAVAIDTPVAELKVSNNASFPFWFFSNVT